MAVAVHDGVAHHVHAHPAHLAEGLPEAVEAESLRLHQGQQLLHRELRRGGLDEARRRVDDVAGGEDDLAPVALEGVDLLLGPGRDPLREVLVALGEEVGLQVLDVLDRRGMRIDDDVVHHLERGEVRGPQLLGHVGTEVRLGGVHVGGEAGDEEVGLLLGVHQVP